MSIPHRRALRGGIVALGIVSLLLPLAAADSSLRPVPPSVAGAATPASVTVHDGSAGVGVDASVAGIGLHAGADGIAAAGAVVQPGVAPGPSAGHEGPSDGDRSADSNSYPSEARGMDPSPVGCVACAPVGAAGSVPSEVNDEAARTLAAAGDSSPTLLSPLTNVLQSALGLTAGLAAPAMAASQAGAEAAADSAPVLASSSEGAAVAVATNPATAIMIGAVVAAIPDGVVVDAWWKRLFVGIAGYTRLMRNRLLDMENRNRLHDFVRAHPGAATRTVMVEGRFSRSTTVYHLRVLEREGFIVSRLVGRTRFWYPVGQSGLISQEALALLQHPTAQAIASTVATEPGISQVDLCRRLGLGASLVHWHVTRLETAGAIMRAPESRRPVYLPASGLSQALNAAAVATRRSFAG